MRFSQRMSNDALSLPFPAYKIPVAIGFCATTIVLYTLYLQWGNALADSIDIGIVLAISGWILILPSAISKDLPAEFRPVDAGEQDSSAAVVQATNPKIKRRPSQRDMQRLQHWEEDKEEVNKLQEFLRTNPNLTWQDCLPANESTFLGVLRKNPNFGARKNRTKVFSGLEQLRKQRDCDHTMLLRDITALRENCSPYHIRDVLSALERENARVEVED